MAEEKQGNNPNIIFRIPLAFLITVVDYEGIKEDLLCEMLKKIWMIMVWTMLIIQNLVK